MSKIELKYEYPITNPQTEVKVVDCCEYRYYTKSKGRKYYMNIEGEMISVSNKTDKVKKVKMFKSWNGVRLHFHIYNENGIQKRFNQCSVWLDLFYPNSDGCIHFKNGDDGDFTKGNVTLITPQNIKLEDGEIMKTIRGYDDYQITNFGRVFSFREIECRDVTKGRSGDDYVYVKLYNEFGFKSISVHRLVGEYFVDGKTDDKCYIHHKNHNKLDNHFSNLEWVTPKENTNYYFQYKTDTKQSISIQNQ